MSDTVKNEALQDDPSFLADLEEEAVREMCKCKFKQFLIGEYLHREEIHADLACLSYRGFVRILHPLVEQMLTDATI